MLENMMEGWRECYGFITPQNAEGMHLFYILKDNRRPSGKDPESLEKESRIAKTEVEGILESLKKEIFVAVH